MDAPDRKTLAAWFQKMQLPYDAILLLEYESEAGLVREVEARQPSMV